MTTNSKANYADLEAVLMKEKLDFVQLNYNIFDRSAEESLIPLAQEKGVAVIVSKPFEKGGLFRFVGGLELPKWANEFDCKSWSQFFLKFILSNPAVTCVIPSTSKVHHMQENMQSLYGKLPDQNQRKLMKEFIDSLRAI